MQTTASSSYVRFLKILQFYKILLLCASSHPHIPRILLDVPCQCRDESKHFLQVYRETMLARWFLIPSLILKPAQHVPKYCKNSKSVSMSRSSGRHSSINHFLTPSIFLTAYPSLSHRELGHLTKLTHQQSITGLRHRDRKPHTLTAYLWPIQKYECFWPVEGNQSNQRTPTQTHREHAHTGTQNCQ